jgi:antitoxin component of MazEF toxin-antitoxin module
VIKQLTRTGNSLALILDRPILDLVQIEPDMPVEISTDNGQRLIITPVKDPARRKRFLDAVERSNRKHAKTYKRLAE